MTENIEGKLLAWVEEAMELRHGEADDPKGKVGLPPYELGQDAAVDMLQRVRQRLDRVEELQSLSRQALGRVLRLREQADFELSLKYDESIATNANRFLDYQSADEKRADASLASLNEKRQQHQMKRLESFAKEALDVIGQCYWGLVKLREDIHEMLFLQRGLSAEEVQT